MDLTMVDVICLYQAKLHRLSHPIPVDSLLRLVLVHGLPHALLTYVSAKVVSCKLEERLRLQPLLLQPQHLTRAHLHSITRFQSNMWARPMRSSANMQQFSCGQPGS